MPVLKKRKLSTTIQPKKAKDTSPEPENTAAADAFRKFFESQFQPLDPDDVATTTTAQQQASDESDEFDEDGESDVDFDGFSEGEDDESDDNDERVPEVKVVEHADVKNEDVLLDKQTRKALLSSKVSSLTNPSGKQTPRPKQEENTTEEANNLKNDLALQRLLNESHLLDSASDLNPTGKNRHKAIDLRLQSLGAKNSIFEQHKMPKSQRIGIQSKAAKREETRRRDARENGVILEKPTFKQKRKEKRRERGVDAPAVGKFAGGTLRLSKQDLASITGPKKRTKMGKKSRR